VAFGELGASGGIPLEPQLSENQRALLRDFNRKAGGPAVDREFKLVGEPPLWRLERMGIRLDFRGSEQELLMLARSGYLRYSSGDRTVSFLARACDGESRPNSLAPLLFGQSGARRRLRAVFYKDRTSMWVQVCAIAAVAVVGILFLLGVVSSDAAGTLAALGALVVAIIQIRQRGTG
jgi:hypothetical protein